MTQKNPPTMAEALEALQTMVDLNTAIDDRNSPNFIKRAISKEAFAAKDGLETIRAALSPAPVEGLDDILHEMWLSWLDGGKYEDRLKRLHDIVVRNYAQSQRCAVPDGWKLVPVEPTEEMIQAGRDEWQQSGNTREGFTWAWTSMLSAAPPVARGALKEGDAVVSVKNTAYALAFCDGQKCTYEARIGFPTLADMHEFYGQIVKGRSDYFKLVSAPPSSAEREGK